jgi:hypothetical protein
VQHVVRATPGVADSAVMQQPAPVRRGFRLRDHRLPPLTGLDLRASVAILAGIMPRIAPRIMR